MPEMPKSKRFGGSAAFVLVFLFVAASCPRAQDTSAQAKGTAATPVAPAKGAPLKSVASPSDQPVPDKGVILEEVIARVNNDAITRGDLEQSKRELHDETLQDCRTCTEAQIDEKMALSEKDLLRDLIDNSLLVQRGKDLGINVDTDVIKRLDEIRQQNRLASMDELEQRVTATGRDFEDFKAQIRNQLIEQEVIRREVGSKVIPNRADILQYYEAHKSEFVKPEEVQLREIFVATVGKTETEIAAQKKKADGLLERVKSGEDFGELAKRFSDGPTAKDGGDLGLQKRGELAPNLEDIVFKLNRNEFTDVLTTKTGFLILQVQEHYPSGQQPETMVDNEIAEKLAQNQMAPALRDYLKTIREDSYVQVKPGYVDTAAIPGDTGTIEEVPATPDNSPAAKKTHRLLPFGKKKNGA
jgi:peptidyl-prolyl cis-trans isomerase SurA